MTNSTSNATPIQRKSQRSWRARGWRVLGWIGLLVVMGIGLLGYVNPSLRMNWETLAAMCGF